MYTPESDIDEHRERLFQRRTAPKKPTRKPKVMWAHATKAGRIKCVHVERTTNHSWANGDRYFKVCVTPI